MKRRKAKGMFTIEAVVIVPLITLIVVTIIHTSIQLYQWVQESAQDTAQVEELNTQGWFLLDSEADSAASQVVEHFFGQE